MNCPKCHAVVEPNTLLLPSVPQIARGLVTDWQVWTFGFGVTVAAGLASGALHLGSVAGAASGGASGIFIALRMRTLRRCPHCDAVTRFPTPPPAR